LISCAKRCAGDITAGKPATYCLSVNRFIDFHDLRHARDGETRGQRLFRSHLAVEKNKPALSKQSPA
jgi:hypothetical protein